MPRADLVVDVPIVSTARVRQMSALFDVPPSERSSFELHANLPIETQPWNIGLIVGPSGSGKSTLARHLFPSVLTGFTWSSDHSVLDAFPKELGIRDVTTLLGSVGFNSPPNWLRPFGVLSTGEQFRVTVARALADSASADIVAIDEFTSVVDRQVAQIASNSVQKFVRKQKRQLVAISCHYDIIEWLQPDWIYDTAAQHFARRSVQQRPAIELALYKIDRTAWPIFSHHHYLSNDLHKAAQCFGAFIDGKIVAFASYLHFPHPIAKNIKYGHRLVVLPDYQGLGIGGRLDDFVGQYLWDQKWRFRVTAAHPARIAYLRKSPRWSLVNDAKRLQVGAKAKKQLASKQLDPRRLNTKTFEYIAPKTA